MQRQRLLFEACLSVQGEQDKKIHVLTSCPGPVVTDFFRRSSKGKENPSGIGMPVEVAVRSILRQIQTERKEVIFDWKYSPLFHPCFWPLCPPSFFTAISKRGNQD